MDFPHCTLSGTNEVSYPSWENESAGWSLKTMQTKLSTAWQQLVNRCFFAKCSAKAFATFYSRSVSIWDLGWNKTSDLLTGLKYLYSLFTCAPVVQGKLEFELPVAELQLFMASILTAWYGLVVVDFISPLLNLHLLSTHINTYWHSSALILCYFACS